MGQTADQARGMSEAASAALLEATGLGAYVADAAGRVIWANTRFHELDEPTRERILAATRGAEAVPGRTVEVANSDNSRAYEVRVSPLAAPPGSYAALIRDVTPERALRRKLDAIERAGVTLVGLDADAVRKVNAADRLKLLQQKIVALCRDLLHFDHFAIRLIDKRTGRLEIVMAEGLPAEAMELEIYPRADGNGISGYVAATGRSYVCRDVEADALFLPGIVGARSSLTVPLQIGERIIGIFDVESQQPAAFGDEDRQFAEIFARYVAMALHMLDLLVVERSSTNEAVSGRVAGELAEPLDDILEETDWFQELANRDPEAGKHLDRIKSDVASIRRRLREVTSGPQTLLGVERAMIERRREPLLEGKRVLVADDEPNVRRIIHDILHNRGCKVWTFDDGAGAITALEEVRAGKRPPFDAILSDIKMPDRNGYEVYAAARACQPGVPVVLMTGFGYDPHHSIVRASQEGLQAVLFKPFPVERLLEEVRKAVSVAGGKPG